MATDQDEREDIPLDEGLPKIIDSALRLLDTATIGIVERYDAEAQTVQVQPVVMRKRHGQDEPVARPLVDDVRVGFPGSGDVFLVSSVRPGDLVLLVTPSRSLDGFFASGEVSEPGAPRMMDISDSIAIPLGLFADANVLSGLPSDGSAYLRTRDGTVSIKVSTSGVDVLGDLAVAGDVSVAGGITVTGGITAIGAVASTLGDVVAGAISLKLHTHPLSGETPGNTGPPTV